MLEEWIGELERASLRGGMWKGKKVSEDRTVSSAMTAL
jgi:hypothetical protein